MPITMVIGDTLKLTMEENQAAGYKIFINSADTSSYLQVLRDEYIAPTSGLLGAPGTHVY